VTGVGQTKALNQKALANCGMTRCLLELGLGANAPDRLRSQALNTLSAVLNSSPVNQSLLNGLYLSNPNSPTATSVGTGVHVALSSHSSYLNVSSSSEYPSRAQTPSRGRGSGESQGNSSDGSWSSPISATSALISLALETSGLEEDEEVEKGLGGVGGYDDDEAETEEERKQQKDLAMTSKLVELLRVRAAATEVVMSLFAGDEEAKLAVLGSMKVPTMGGKVLHRFHFIG
jgi:hypothetical protein